MPITYADRVQSFEIVLTEAIDKPILDTLIALSLQAQSGDNRDVLCQGFYYDSHDTDMSSLQGSQKKLNGMKLSAHHLGRAQALDMRIGCHSYQVLMPYQDEGRITLRASFASEKALAHFSKQVCIHTGGKLIPERLFNAA